MFVDEIRRQAEAAPRAAMPSVSAALWKAFAAGQVSEADAEALSELIEARKALPVAIPAPRKAVGSRPRTDASMERRRRWAASGRLPPALAARFSLAEQAVLALVSAETARRGDCRLAVGHVAAIVGVAETTVRNAIREARKLGLLTVEERRVTGFRNDTNIVRIVSPEWLAWLRMARRGGLPKNGESSHTSLTRGRGQPPSGQSASRPPSKRTGCKSAQGTNTGSLEWTKKGPSAPSKKAAGGQRATTTEAGGRNRGRG